jgi:hypothetical protein
MYDVFTLVLFASAAATAKEHVEYVKWRAECAVRYATFFESLLTALIVDVSLFGVG